MPLQMQLRPVSYTHLNTESMFALAITQTDNWSANSCGTLWSSYNYSPSPKLQLSLIHIFGSDVTADNSTTYMSFFSEMDTYGDGYAGIGEWRAAVKPLVDRIADTDMRLQWFCCDRSTGVTDASGNRITLIRDTQSPVAVERCV